MGRGFSNPVSSPNTVDTGALVDDSVTNAKIADNAVAIAQMGDNSVSSAEIVDGSVSVAEIATDAVAAAEIQADAVGSSEIAANSVGSSEMADNAIGSAEITDASVTSADIALDTIAAVDIAPDAVGSSEIATDAVDAAEIKADAVGSSEIATGAVGTAEIADGTVAVGDLAFDPATQTELDAVVAGAVTDNTLTAAKLTSALRDVLGIDNAQSKRRGSKTIATQESHSNAAYAAMATPDRVSNVVLPTAGVLRIGFQALWAVGSGTASAGIFINGVQLKQAVANGAPSAQFAQITTGFFGHLSTGPGGLVSIGSGTTNASQVGTGQIIGGSGVNGGFVEVFADAGTYTVEIRYTNGSTVVVKERKLWVEAIGFPAE